MRRLLAIWLLAGNLAAAEYYPSQGHWSYSSGEVQTLAAPTSVRGVAVVPMQHKIGGQLISEDLLQFVDGKVLLRGIRIGGKLTWYLPPLTVYPASPLSPGQSWQSFSSTPQGAVRLSSTVIEAQPLTTPAGKFNALLIRSDLQQGKAVSTQFSYFVPGLGVVRYQAAAGALAVDLVKY